jgi:4-diphosphocytidyl-2-C-methyl-D-erythritol kinase
VKVRSFAKINLTLRVLGTRADGYHELRTAFQSIALHDTLTFTKRAGPFEIRCTDADCPTDASNLVWRAADAVWRAAARRAQPSGVRVDVAKRIPMQAGLGGGSSNAAAALRAFVHLWRARLSDEAMLSIARDLGADVPYFLQGGAALGVGRGDVLFALADRPAAWVVLVRPDIGVSTREAYEWWDADERHATPAPARGEKKRRDAVDGALQLPIAELRNDLEPPVVRRHPEIGRIGAALRGGGADYAAMSGSGSAVFGLFGSRTRALRAAARLQRSGQVVVTVTLDRRRYGRQSLVRSG